MPNIVAEIIQHKQCGFCNQLLVYSDNNENENKLSMCKEVAENEHPKIIEMVKVNYHYTVDIPTWCPRLADSKDKLKALKGALSK